MTVSGITIAVLLFKTFWTLRRMRNRLLGFLGMSNNRIMAHVKADAEELKENVKRKEVNTEVNNSVENNDSTTNIPTINPSETLTDDDL